MKNRGLTPFKFIVLMYKVTLPIYYDLFSKETIMKEPKQR